MSDNTFDPKHPHEPEIPPHFDADGRCLICVMICERDNAIRERDEAREKYDDLATEHMLAINKLAEERDEARDRMAQLLNEKEEAIQQSMRDARRADANAALCSKLRDIAERAITAVALWAGSRTNSASKLRAELDQLKEEVK
jgi:hypothetical protein